MYIILQIINNYFPCQSKMLHWKLKRRCSLDLLIKIWIAQNLIFCVLFKPGPTFTFKLTCSCSEDPDQPVHPLNWFRVFAVDMKKVLVLSYTRRVQYRNKLTVRERIWMLGPSACNVPFIQTLASVKFSNVSVSVTEMHYLNVRRCLSRTSTLCERWQSVW